MPVFSANVECKGPMSMLKTNVAVSRIPEICAHGKWVEPQAQDPTWTGWATPAPEAPPPPWSKEVKKQDDTSVAAASAVNVQVFAGLVLDSYQTTQCGT